MFPFKNPTWLYTPEALAKSKAAREASLAAGVKFGREPGQPDGMKKKEYLILKAAGLERTDKVMAYMAEKDKFIADNEYAHKSLRTAVAILELPGSHVLKLQAAKVLLEYTQRKPVAASAVTLTTAESFLDEIHNGVDSPATRNTEEA